MTTINGLLIRILPTRIYSGCAQIIIFQTVQFKKWFLIIHFIIPLFDYPCVLPDKIRPVGLVMAVVKMEIDTLHFTLTSIAVAAKPRKLVAGIFNCPKELRLKKVL